MQFSGWRPVARPCTQSGTLGSLKGRWPLVEVVRVMSLGQWTTVQFNFWVMVQRGAYEKVIARQTARLPRDFILDLWLEQAPPWILTFILPASARA